MSSLRSRRTRRAIFLVSVLFFSVLITMFVSAAVALVPSALGRTEVDQAVTSADRAAKSGIDWARARISGNPSWNASATIPPISAPGLYVTEGQGLVIGWVQQGSGWSRFRIRFNYQDGPASTLSNSDNMGDPTPSSLMWQDFPYVSCNNLLGSSTKTAPLASGSTYYNSGPWPQAQLSVPGASLLLSVEGAAGSDVVLQGNSPVAFVGNVHTRTVQTVLKFGNNQPITSAAIMSAGDLDATMFAPSTPPPLTLSSVSGETARLRTKAGLDLSSSVYSTNGDLRYGPSTSPTTGPLSSGITEEPDGTSDGFYQITNTSVRTPQSPVVFSAGTYILSPGPSASAPPVLTYVPMNYADYIAASPQPTGTPTTFPAGVTATPNVSGTPRYEIVVSSDMTVSPTPGASGTPVTDFALIPNGGAAQSSAYGGVTPTASATPEGDLGSLLSNIGVIPGEFTTGAPLTPAQANAWLNVVNSFGHGSTPAPTPSTYVDYFLTSDTTSANAPYIGLATTPGGQIYLLGATSLLASTIQNNASASAIAQLMAAYPAASSSPTASGSPSSSASPTATATPLLPADIELNMQGSGTNGMVMANSGGNIVLGSQVQGNSAAIVTQHDISLIGTSTDLSSTPGSALGLNLYAQGNITVDAFRLDSTGTAAFHSINIKGIVYAWNRINMLAGNSTSSGTFNLSGVMVAYGGNPTGSPSPGTGGTIINASSATIQYDPSYVANLQSSGPFDLEVLSWHEF